MSARLLQCAVRAFLLMLCSWPAISQYAGSGACAQCHAAECRAHSGSPHAHALAPSPPGAPGQWAFGAGVKAITYLGRTNDGGYVELGRSYYPRTRSFGATPGHSTGDDLPYPTLAPDASVARCFRCHSTGPLRFVAGLSIEPAENGVGCEACHGPGAKHIASGGEPRAILNPRRLNAVELNQLCGTCHRKPPAPDDPVEDHITVAAKFDFSNRWNVRHQPAYLSQSACFRGGGGALSCLTCHDPHSAAELPLEAYDNRCAGCHWDVKHQSPVSGACASCHMPRVTATDEMSFADHWIGIYRVDGGTVPMLSAHNWPPLSLPSSPGGNAPPPNDPSTLRPLFDQALADSKAQFGPSSAEAARGSWLLGVFLEQLGAAVEAEGPLLEALSIDRANRSQQSASDALELARAYAAAGQPEEAIAPLKVAAQTGDERVRAQSYATLAKLDPPNAVAHYEKAVAAEESASGRDSPRVAALLSNLALAVAAEGGLTSAEAMLRRALRIQTNSFGPGHLRTAVTMNNLATVLRRREGKLEQAEALERESVAIFERKLPNSFELAAGYANLADLVMSRNDVEAEALLRGAIAADEAAGGMGSMEEAADLASLARVLRTKDRVSAAALFRKALAIYEARLGASSQQAAGIRQALASLESSVPK